MRTEDAENGSDEADKVTPDAAKSGAVISHKKHSVR
jgi:hypothetical protein